VAKPDGWLAALVLIGLVAAAYLVREEVEVVSGFAQAIDGDSLRLDGRDVRLSGIDAPELRQSCETRERRPYPCGDVARRALRDMLAGRIVTCRLSGRDRYGRSLASCERAARMSARRSCAGAMRWRIGATSARRRRRAARCSLYGRAPLSGRRNGAKRGAKRRAEDGAQRHEMAGRASAEGERCG
jgi:hypothetical protein